MRRFLATTLAVAVLQFVTTIIAVMTAIGLSVAEWRQPGQTSNLLLYASRIVTGVLLQPLAGTWDPPANAAGQDVADLERFGLNALLWGLAAAAISGILIKPGRKDLPAGHA
jgi:disulfide bond formation protein DsbB